MEIAGADLVGRGFAEALARVDPANAARLAQCLARKESFSGVEIVWPVAGSPAGAPIAIAGTPAFDDRRRFAGFRGFGLIRSERLAASRTEAGET